MVSILLDGLFHLPSKTGLCYTVECSVFLFLVGNWGRKELRKRPQLWVGAGWNRWGYGSWGDWIYHPSENLRKGFVFS